MAVTSQLRRSHHDADLVDLPLGALLFAPRRDRGQVMGAVPGDRRARRVQGSELGGVRVTDSEPRFSSTRDARRVPGIGTEATPRASARYRSHASATCAGVASCSPATDLTTSTTARLASSAPSANRGMVWRKSLGDDRSAAERMVPVKKPRPSGEYGTKPIPSSAT